MTSAQLPRSATTTMATATRPTHVVTTELAPVNMATVSVG